MFFPDFVVFAARFVLVFSFLETTLFVFSTLFGVYILLGVLLISIYNKAIISSFFPYCNSFRIFFIIPPRKPEKYRMTQQFRCQAKPVFRRNTVCILRKMGKA